MAAAAERLTAVVVAVPEAEHLVGAVRDREDPSAGWGVPAHITVVFPFVPLADLDANALQRLEKAVASEPAFEGRLTETRWFDDRVLYLAPDPAEPFVRLTESVTAAFPTVSPYDGLYPDVVPHLTVGMDGADEVLRAAEGRLRQYLPVEFSVHQALLMSGLRETRTWRVERTLPLGGVGRVAPHG